MTGTPFIYFFKMPIYKTIKNSPFLTKTISRIFLMCCCKSCKIINYGNACFMYKDFPFSQASFNSSEYRDVTAVVS